jgi:N-acetylglucosamine-6-sulfatase
VFALRGDRYKYITYYGLWDTDELYDLQSDPDETRNLIDDPDVADVVEEMENRLYAILSEEGGLEIPLNQPRGFTANKRLGSRGGRSAADFPPSMVLDKPQTRPPRPRR